MNPARTAAMTPLVLTPDQTAVVYASEEPVRIIAAAGGIVGWINPSGRPPKRNPFTAEELAAAERAVVGSEDCQTTAEVLARLRAMGVGE
jgi:hypothetical protein